MITLFNRKELILTYSMKEQGNVRMLLAQNKIPYKIKTQSRESRASRGTAGLNQDFLYEYRIYVHKDDYEKACAVLQGKIHK